MSVISVAANAALRCAHCHSTELEMYPTTDGYIRFCCDNCSSREVEARVEQ